MAKVYEKASHARDTYKKYLIIGFILICCGIALLIYVDKGVRPFSQRTLYNFLNILASACFMAGTLSFATAAKYYAGAKGKKTTLNLLKQLPDSYRIVTNPSVVFDGKKSQLDTVVVGPKGVFVIQTKNHNGTIDGNYSDKYWTQYKVGQKGGEYSKKLYSPVKQVSTHVYRLSNMLKQNGIYAWVQGVVYFSNILADVKIYALKPVPVLAHYSENDNEILDYITEYQNKKTLTPAEIEQIVKILL